MVDVIAQNRSEMALSGDQHAVEAFAAQGADPARSAMAFVLGARTGVRMMSMSAAAEDWRRTGGERRRGHGSRTGTAAQSPSPW
jgi:hypothetical protein